MLLSDRIFSLSIFSLFLISLLYWLFMRGIPHLITKIREFVSASLPKKLRTILVILFLAMIIIVNILPFNFLPYDELELKYDYSFYLQAKSEIAYGVTYATNLGGLYLIFPLLYRLSGISSFQSTLLFNKVLMTLMIPVYFILLRKILGFFLPEKRWKYSLSTLLTMLYLSMPQTNNFFWTSRLYYFSAHIFFIIAFAFLLEYLRSKSVLDFLLYLLSLVISVQTRPEFAAFAVLLLAIHLLFVFDFSRFRFKNQGTKERAHLIINLAFVAFLTISAAVFMHNYGEIRLGGGILQTLWSGMENEFGFLLGLFNPSIICLFSLLSLGALIYCPTNRKYILLILLFICALFVYIMPTVRFEPTMYTLYVYVLLFCILAYALSWVLASKVLSLGYITISLLIILITLSNLYLITSEQNLFITGGISNYNRRLELQKDLDASAAYEQMKSNNSLIFDKFAGKLYFSYVFKDTNNTIVGLSELKGLNTTYKNDTRRKLIFMRYWSQVCTKERVIQYIEEDYENPESSEIPSQSDYPTIIRNIQNSEIKSYTLWDTEVFCEIIFPEK